MDCAIGLPAQNLCVLGSLVATSLGNEQAPERRAASLTGGPRWSRRPVRPPRKPRTQRIARLADGGRQTRLHRQRDTGALRRYRRRSRSTARAQHNGGECLGRIERAVDECSRNRRAGRPFAVQPNAPVNRAGMKRGRVALGSLPADASMIHVGLCSLLSSEHSQGCVSGSNRTNPCGEVPIGQGVPTAISNPSASTHRECHCKTFP